VAYANEISKTSNDFAELITNLYDIEVTRLKHTITFVTVAYGSIVM